MKTKVKIMANVWMMARCSNNSCNNWHSNSLMSRSSHRNASVEHIGNHLSSPTCTSLQFSDVVFGSVWGATNRFFWDVDRCSFFAPNCCLRLMDMLSFSLVDFGAPTRYTFSIKSSDVCIHSKIFAPSKVLNPYLRHWVASSVICILEFHTSISDGAGFVSPIGSTFVSTSIFVIWSNSIWATWSIKGSNPHRCGMCLSIIIRISSKYLHLLTRSQQSQIWALERDIIPWSGSLHS